MKNNMEMIQTILKKYQKYYQTTFKLTINNHDIFDELDNNKTSFQSKFYVNNKKAVIYSSKEIDLETIIIILKELLNVDITFLVKKAIFDELSYIEKMQLSEYLQSNKYSILIIQSNTTSEYLYSTISNILTGACFEIELNKKVVVILPNKICKQLLREVKDTLESELYCKINYSYTNVFNDLSEVSNKYKEAEDLLSLRIKYNLSLNEKNLWLAYVVENLKDEKVNYLVNQIDLQSFDLLDEELLNTIQVFLQNNLNIAETARKMYIHRNTLIYRIEKISSLINLDIRNFEDALKVEFALLLRKK